MLTRLHFKNWRSLRDVTIDNLTPITVFVGANSSGKTNILDALHFLHRSIEAGLEVTVYNWKGLKKIRSLNADSKDAVEVEITFNWSGAKPITDKTILNSDQNGLPYERTLAEGDATFRTPVGAFYSEREEFNRRIQVVGYSNLYRKERWQLLRENMVPSLSLSSDSALSDPYLIDPLARNVPLMLDFVQRYNLQIYDELQADLGWLLGHVNKLETMRDERETRVLIRENPLQGREAPTVSAGTARIVAMLTAYYALDMRNPELPGLVVIEEPDTAIHPLLLRNFVELLRQYTSDPERPRQFILTTHNPMFLNLFKPEEVRIVERDEQGDTTVREVNKDVANVWYEKYGDYSLGDIWTTRLLGGVPE